MTAEREKATMLYSASRLEEEMKVVLRGDNSESRVAASRMTTTPTMENTAIFSHTPTTFSPK